MIDTLFKTQTSIYNVPNFGVSIIYQKKILLFLPYTDHPT